MQNISMAAVDFDSRNQPSEADIISQGFSGKGGCCLHLNYFAKIVLRALGLDAYTIQGTHYKAPVEGTHCMVAVRLQNPNDVYLVEVGGAFPILEPMSMTQLPVRITTAGGFPYEFREVSPGVVGRYHIGGGLLMGKFVSCDFRI
jgi:arylamine N-acetyltransferase